MAGLRFYDLIYETVLQRLVWRHEEVAIRIFLQGKAMTREQHGQNKRRPKMLLASLNRPYHLRNSQLKAKFGTIVRCAHCLLKLDHF